MKQMATRDYQIIRSSRKTVAVQILPNGQVVVRSPQKMREEAIRRFVESKEDWIAKHLKKTEASARPEPYTEQELNALIRQAKETIPAKVERYAKQLGASYGRITIRKQKTLWGSCSSKGNLNFNCLLMLAPEAVQDYIVVHELCHRKEMNHSARFWAAVAQVLPDYESRRKWLRDNGPALMARLYS